MKYKNSCILAPNESIDFTDSRINYPMLASIKYDGIRCIILDGIMYSRYMKPFKNIKLPEYFKELIEWSKSKNLVIDMEIYDPSEKEFGNICSYGSSLNKSLPNTVKGYIIDVIPIKDWNSSTSSIFQNRYEYLIKNFPKITNCIIVEQELVNSAKEAENLMKTIIKEKHEGIMLRNPSGLYKYGRCTVLESNLLKFKKFFTIDGEILEVLTRKQMKESVKKGHRKLDAFGNKETIHTKDSFEDSDICAGFLAKFDNGITCKVNYGKGFNIETRKEHLANKENLIGKRIEVSYMKHGMKDKLRLPTFIRFRPDQD